MHPIQVKELNHWFGQGEAKKQALFDINLDIEKGKLTILMGPSGSGKTTLLTIMGCLRDVQQGSIQVLGNELLGLDDWSKENLRRKFGFIFQAHNLHESLTAIENVLMGLEVHGLGQKDKQNTAAKHVLSLFGLGDRMHYLPENLSGGQKQRVAIARALVSNPQIIFADEPTAALDSTSGKNVVQTLKVLGEQRGVTTIMVTHDNRILEYADRIITLEDGRIISDKLV
ncbi:ATP-binding cassette domain-containing protein [Saccharophagus degradans]|uniref:ABC transporter related n=1 Tax=Saccharophagus degradans (strain 2-40 / ATCC 43961 / DSM 17024) TaxID=203122 RepID=Q21GY6_SACD2|nr:ATP-binding cassette domain-containing protein [Saccharophagus degradans]ABD82043.1 ABC transporter related [Saccharophagus degradans 2-40]